MAKQKPNILRATDSPQLAEDEVAGELFAERIERLYQTAHELAQKIQNDEPLEVHESETAAQMIREWAASLPDHSSKRGNPKNEKKIDASAKGRLIKLLQSGESKTAAYARLAEEYGVSNQAMAKSKVLKGVAEAWEFAKSTPHED